MANIVTAAKTRRIGRVLLALLLVGSQLTRAELIPGAEVVRKLTGKVKAHAVVESRLPVAGRVVSEQRHMGDRVGAGDVLVQVDDREAQQRLALRQAELQRANAEYGLADKQLQRLQASHARGVISDLDVDQARLDLQRRAAEIKIARAQLSMAAIHVEDHRVVAPTDGVLVADGPAQGTFLNINEPVLSLLDDSAVNVVVRLSAAEVAQLNSQQLRLCIGTDSRQELQLQRIAPRVASNSTLIEAHASLPAGEKETALITGSLLDLRLYRTEKDNIAAVAEQ